MSGISIIKTMGFQQLLDDEKELEKCLSDKKDRVSLLEVELRALHDSLKSKSNELSGYLESEDRIKDLYDITRKTLQRVVLTIRSPFWRILLAFRLYDRAGNIIKSYINNNNSALKMFFPEEYLLAVKPEKLIAITKRLEDALQAVAAEASRTQKDYQDLKKRYLILNKQLEPLVKLIEKIEKELSITMSIIDNESIVGGSPLNGSKERESFKADLKMKIPKTANLTDDQWRFILSTHRNTNVVAGAGSGKSTALIYRVIFLLKCAQVDIDKECTIFTFTRKTRTELIEKLQEALRAYNIESSEESLENIVHTFHSKAWQIASAFANYKHQEFFEFQGKSQWVYLSAAEFEKQGKSITALCAAIKKMDYVSTSFSAPDNTIKWLKEFLKQPELSAAIIAITPSLVLSKEVVRLWDKTEKIRKRPFDRLEVTQQQAIVKLNRLILEQAHPSEMPKVSGHKEVATDDVISSQLTDEQAYLLNKAYAYAWNHEKGFKKVVCDLYEKSRMCAPVIKPGAWRDGAYWHVQEDDEKLIDDTLLLAKYVNSEDITEKEKRENCKVTYKHEDDPYYFYAHHRIEKRVNDKTVIYFIHYLSYDNADRELRKKITRKKRTIVTHDAKNNHIFIENEDDYIKWKRYENRFLNSYNDDSLTEEPIYFKCELQGFIKPEEIVDALYAEGSFMEYLGRDVVKDCRTILQLKDNKLDKASIAFLRVLEIFWGAFDRYLRGEEIKRFHEVFSCLSFDKVKPHVERMQHLLLDEFQDINPEIACWIKKILLYLKDNKYSCSITCVGDDYQSIYGWRGSAPVYLLNYADNFPSRNIVYPPIKMVHNFRSLQPIISAGEKVLEKMHRSDPKKGKQGNDDIVPLDSNPVEIIEVATQDDMEKVIKELVRKYRVKSNKIFFMSRTNKPLEPYSSSENIIYQTYHKSKGLEADLCVLLNDCNFPESYPIRNAVYALAWKDQHEYPLSYDQAQEDEAKRLGYVAITRSMKKVIILDYENDDRVGAFTSLKKYFKTESLSKQEEARKVGG